jgi:hypothetical protein
MRAKLGTAQAITATAHKIARILYHVLLSSPAAPKSDKAGTSTHSWTPSPPCVSGSLAASRREPGAICAVRSLWRHRSSLLQMASEHTLHMQKALSQMNLQIHHVLSDITGVSGLAILDAVLVGERDPMRLAQLCHAFVKTPHEIVAKALVGDYRPEHLFTLKQSLDGYRFYKKLITELDEETARLMQAVPSAGRPLTAMPTRTKHTVYQRNGNDPRFDLRSELYRIAGVDLTDVPGGTATYISCAPMSIPAAFGSNSADLRTACSFRLAIIVSLCAGERGPRRESLQSPNRDRCARLQASSLTCPPPQTHAFRRAHPAPMPTSGRSLPRLQHTHHRSTEFLPSLSGRSPVNCFPVSSILN